MGRISLSWLTLALLAPVLSQCHEHVAGNTVDVVVHHGPARNGHVTLAQVELRACPTAALSWPSLIASAHAHTEGSATRLGDVHVIALGFTPTEYGVLHPPDGDYCSVGVQFGPADEDARDLQGTGMEGLTFLVDGFSHVQPIEVEAELQPPLRASNSVRQTLKLTLVLPGGFSDALAVRQSLERSLRAEVEPP